jgi:hypothetical protein
VSEDQSETQEVWVFASEASALKRLADLANSSRVSSWNYPVRFMCLEVKP